MDLILGYSKVNSGTVQELFEVSGQGAIYAVRYNQNFRKWGDMDHRLVYGLDYRAYQNRVTPVGGTFNFVPDITVHPLSLTYSGQIRGDQRDYSFYLGYSRNISGGNDGGDVTFKNSRRDSRAAYRIWRFGASHSATFFKEWQYRLKLDAQYSPDALIAAEQFGMGGAESVRGFNERNSVQPGELHRVSLDSVGFGMRMSYGTRLTVKADYAQVMHDGTQTGREAGRTYNNRWHIMIGYVF